MTETSIVRFIETKQYRRFEEFCDACKRHSYIGLCYGPPGVGKTLSARYYSRAYLIDAYDARLRAAQFSPDTVELHAIVGHDVVFYTAGVVSSPGRLASDISRLRDRLLGLIRQHISITHHENRKYLRRREKEEHDKWFNQADWFNTKKPDKAEREYLKACLEYSAQYQSAKDPTRLIIVDEADRLKMSGLEQLRAIFDGGEVGLILIGMPGIEKRLARYPQL
jgi:DNA transposition AAA+ family ATPase